MSVYFHKDPRKSSMKQFSLKRYFGKNGEYYELRKNKMPRGLAYRRLNALEWKANYKRLEQAGIQAKILVDDINRSRTKL